MADDVLIFLAVAIIAGAIAAWAANLFTIKIPFVFQQVYWMLLIGLIVYLVIMFMRTA